MPNAKRSRENAENCAEVAEEAAGEASRRRYQRMEQTYLRLAETEEWLDGQVSPFGRQEARLVREKKKTAATWDVPVVNASHAT